METLRDLLKSKNPELHASFLETWKYLEHNILPLMGPNNESLNSLPHLKNNEEYLNGILPISDKLFDEKESIYLSPQELYVILMAIALHDIGRIKEKLEGKDDKYYSEKMIKDSFEKKANPSKADFFRNLKTIYNNSEFSPENIYSEKVISDCWDHTNEHTIDSFLILLDEKLSKEFEKIEKHSHGLYSKDFIIKEWEKLRIPSFELAKAIGEICLIHEPEEKKKERHPEIKVEVDKIELNIIDFNGTLDEQVKFEKKSLQALNNDGGSIRINELGSLLSLVDNMDATFRRLAKLDVLQKASFETSLAIFRDNIEGVYFNKDNQAVIITIGIKFDKEDNEKLINYDNKLFSQGKVKKININDSVKKKIEDYHNQKHGNFFNRKGYYDENLKIENSEFLLYTEWAIINGTFLNAKTKSKEIIPIELILPMIFGSVRSCNQNLLSKYKYLYRIGIPIKTWLINFEEHLFNYYGEETFEPIFTKEYLKDLAQTMWKLSTRIFGRSFFTYEMLGSALNENDITKVKLGVKRLEIISRNDKNEVSAINYNANGWNWEFSEEEDKCNFISNRELEKIIDNLGEPILNKKENGK
jgi:hypothetical protein